MRPNLKQKEPVRVLLLERLNFLSIGDTRMVTKIEKTETIGQNRNAVPALRRASLVGSHPTAGFSGRPGEVRHRRSGPVPRSVPDGSLCGLLRTGQSIERTTSSTTPVLLKAMTQQIRETLLKLKASPTRSPQVEMTGVYHRPFKRPCVKRLRYANGFTVATASGIYESACIPDLKTDDKYHSKRSFMLPSTVMVSIARGKIPRSMRSLQTLARHRRQSRQQKAAIAGSNPRLDAHRIMPGYAPILFCKTNKLF